MPKYEVTVHKSVTIVVEGPSMHAVEVFSTDFADDIGYEEWGNTGYTVWELEDVVELPASDPAVPTLKLDSNGFMKPESKPDYD